MKKLLKILSFGVLTIALSFCGSINKTMQAWVGHHKSELYQNWGPPSRITDDGQGGEILIYEYSQNNGQTPGRVTPNYAGGYNYTAPQQNTYYRSRMFYCDKSGQIYNWRWQGL